MEPWVKPTQWQGTYLVLLNSRTVLCATSDRFLESVLRRVDVAPEARALPESMPEWKQVDFNAPAWMIRHIPKVDEKAHAVGATAAFRRDGFRIVYIPKTGTVLDGKKIEAQWLLLRNRIKTERRTDGTIVLSSDEKPGEDTMWFIWQLYRLQAFELF